MATITDSLETILKLTGTAQMVAGLGAAATASEGLAVAEGVATTATATLGATFLAVAGPLLATIAGVTTLAAAFVKAAHDFGQSELAAVRIGNTMKNLGNVFPTQQLLDFASALSKTTGIDDELIATLGATAAQFGLNRQQIERLLPTVLDIAQIKNIDPSQVLQTLLRASRGRPQGLVAIGIDPSKIKGDLKDVDNLISQVGQGFRGGAADVRNTLPGTIQALKTSVENLFEALGKLFGDTLQTIINRTIVVIDLLTRLVELVGRFRIFGGHTEFTPAGGGTANALALKGDPEQTGLLRNISNNTEKQADALAREVLGGAGTVAATATTWRDYQMAFGV